MSTMPPVELSASKIIETLEALQEQGIAAFKEPENLGDLENCKAGYLGPKGEVTLISKAMGKLSKEDKPVVGQAINKVKQALETALNDKRQELENAAIAKRLGPKLDPTVPADFPQQGILHPLTQTRREVVKIFGKMGFVVTEGPEVDTTWYCFDALNTPESHPARDEQDTLYLNKDVQVSNVRPRKDEDYLLRTHTSTIQIRTMLQQKPPMSVVCCARAFRRDTVDATHSANFHQTEALLVDKGVSVADLKACLDFFVKEMFGDEVETRLRPSFFPFTEPSYELDVKSPHLGKLSNQWIEIMGCGMVDPEVFKSVDIDSEVWSGFAFGMGIERLAMIKHRIDDIRHFYTNDLRFLNQFA